jgi:hypothetical protein
MPVQFAGPALQGASLIGRYGIPLVQQLGIGAGLAGIGAGIAKFNQAKPQTGAQKLSKSWGKIPDSLYSSQGGSFGYRKDGGLPNYSDPSGNVYDAVSGRLLYAAKPRQNAAPETPFAETFVAGSSSPQERAYQSEKARVAQLTAQDPELQRYEKASAAAKTQEEMNAARDIGMAIWARANPKLAAKVKPGQSGYEVIQNEINAGQMGPVQDLPFDTTKPFSPTPIPPEQRSVTYEGVRPVSLGEVKPIAGGGFPTAQAAMFERFAQPAAPTFQGSPLGTASPLVGNLSYTGSVAPLGLAVEEGDFRSAKAQQLADAFKKARFSS